MELDGMDLTELVPDLSVEEVTRMRAAAKVVEDARLPDDTFRWNWWPENLQNNPVAEYRLLVLGTTLVLCTKNISDRLELNLWISREQHPRLTVSADIEVACWCDDEHGMHAVRREERLVGTAAALTEAFESAAAAIVRWSAESHDPIVHRAAAGLPNPATR